jgi:hypothetical protein
MFTGLMEERNRYNAREDYGGHAFQQVVNCPNAWGGPKLSATHSLHEEHLKTGQESQGNHQPPSVRQGTCYMYDPITKQTIDRTITDSEEDRGHRLR